MGAALARVLPRTRPGIVAVAMRQRHALRAAPSYASFSFIRMMLRYFEPGVRSCSKGSPSTVG
jgi:hypothetical protein